MHDYCQADWPTFSFTRLSLAPPPPPPLTLTIPTASATSLQADYNHYWSVKTCGESKALHLVVVSRPAVEAEHCYQMRPVFAPPSVSLSKCRQLQMLHSTACSCCRLQDFCTRTVLAVQHSGRYTSSRQSTTRLHSQIHVGNFSLHCLWLVACQLQRSLIVHAVYTSTCGVAGLQEVGVQTTIKQVEWWADLRTLS